MPGYPITPQTSIMEAIAAMVEKGELHARFIPVEGEHSAMAAAVAAAAAGARFYRHFGQWLAYMHEVLHMAAGGTPPVVMVNVNRVFRSLDPMVRSPGLICPAGYRLDSISLLIEPRGL